MIKRYSAPFLTNVRPWFLYTKRHEHSPGRLEIIRETEQARPLFLRVRQQLDQLKDGKALVMPYWKSRFESLPAVRNHSE